MKTLEQYMQETINRKLRQTEKREKELKTASQFHAVYREGLKELQRILHSFQALQKEEDERQENLF